MKVICENCYAPFDIDLNKVPSSGARIKCKVCSHSFAVLPDGSKPRGLEVTRSGPAPTLPAIPPPMPPSSESAPTLAKEELGLRPKATSAAPTLPSLPIPPPSPSTGLSPAPPEPASSSPASALDLLIDETIDALPVESLALESPEPPPEESELPVPRHHRPSSHASAVAPLLLAEEEPDLPMPKAATPHRVAAPPDDADAADLPVPKAPAADPVIGLSLDAPDIDDLEALNLEASPLDSDFGASLDLPTPRLDSDATEVAPKAESFDLAPRSAPSFEDSTNAALSEFELPSDPGGGDFTGDPIASSSEAVPALSAESGTLLDLPPDPLSTEKTLPVRTSRSSGKKTAKKEEPPSQWRRLGLGLGGVAATVLISGGLLSLTEYGPFAINYFLGPNAAEKAIMARATTLISDDSSASLRKGSALLRPLTAARPRLVEAAALEAQSHLRLAILGIASETQAADLLLARYDDNRKAQSNQSLKLARAMQLAATEKWVDARSRLRPLIDGQSPVYALCQLGSVEIGAGDFPSAERAFARALAAEPHRACAHYGIGFCRERNRNLAEAQKSYETALLSSPQHLRAQVGLWRVQRQLGKDEGLAGKLVDAIDKRQPAPVELAEIFSLRGDLARSEARFDDADHDYRQALALSSRAVDARAALSELASDRQDAGEAVEIARQAVAAGPHNLGAHLALLRGLVDLRSAKEAEAALAVAKLEAPADARVTYFAGRVALIADKPDHALALDRFEAAIGRDPKLAAAYVAAAVTLSADGKSTAALDLLQKAEAQAGDDPARVRELGAAYVGLGKLSEAEAIFRRALQKSDVLAIRLGLSQVLERENRLEDALSVLQPLEKLSPMPSGLTGDKARILSKLGKRQEARLLYEKALAEKSASPSLRLEAGEFLLQEGAAKQARQVAEAMVVQDDRSASAQLLVARADFELGAYDTAMLAAKRAATLSDSAEAHLTLGRALEQLGKSEAAIAEYRLAERPPVADLARLGRTRVMVHAGATRDALHEIEPLRKHPKLGAEAELLAGDCFSDLQDTDAAIAAYETAVQKGPANGEAAFKLGRLYHDDGKRKPAILQFERALRLGGDHAPYAIEASLLLGDAHREGREPGQAISAYRHYLELAPPNAPGRADVERQIRLLKGQH